MDARVLRERTETEEGFFSLSTSDQIVLHNRLSEALAKARTSYPQGILTGLTVRVGPEIDPCRVVFASRQSEEDWFFMENQDKEHTALGTLGCALSLQGSGTGRFEEIAARWRKLSADAIGDRVDNGIDFVLAGGFAFAPDGGMSPHWSRFASASMQVGEVTLARFGDSVRLTLASLVRPQDDVSAIMARLVTRASSLRNSALPTPAVGRQYRIFQMNTSEDYEEAVSIAVERIDMGTLEKVVLAREVCVEASDVYDSAAIIGDLREHYPSCNIYGVGRGDNAFLGASPELLIRREGAKVSTVSLAGSIRRSNDPTVDKDLGNELLNSAKNLQEQAIVTRWIERILRQHSDSCVVSADPVLIKTANIQHLFSPIQAHLSSPIGAVRLAGLLHPTPAVGGEPLSEAQILITSLEGMDRGWYAGAVGWTDTNEDGEFCVALRSALVSGSVARCYAGVGVVRDSDPATELAETEVKLLAIMSVLTEHEDSLVHEAP